MKNIRILAALLLLGAMAFCLFSCGTAGDTNATNDTTEAVTTEADTTAEDTTAAPAFTVKVVDGEGNAVEGALVQLCKESCIPARTDASGVATFNTEITDGHKLSVLSCPEGYEYTGEAEIYLTSGATEYTIELSKVG